MSTLPSLRTELDALRAATEHMAQIIGGGDVVDLASLEDSVAGFCGRLQKLPAETGRELRGGLIALIDDLSKLDGLMRTTQSDIAQRLGESTQRRRATVAYGTAPGK
jgi:hypothetical protein